jgi:hypothetical protein
MQYISAVCTHASGFRDGLNSSHQASGFGLQASGVGLLYIPENVKALTTIKSSFRLQASGMGLFYIRVKL